MNKIYEENFNNQGYLMKIVQYNNANDIIVEFQDKNKARVHTQYYMFKKGMIRNPFHPIVCGIGYLGNSNSLENGKVKKSYQVWNSMMHRCYAEYYLKDKPTYQDCSVCNEWLCYANFEKWFNENYYEVENEEMNLDKDILVKGNKIYSPDTCIFVPRRINSLFKSSKIKFQNNKNNKFSVRCVNENGKRIFLGTYQTEQEAILSYKNFKENTIKRIAQKYKDKIPEKLYNAMVEWKYE